VNPGETHAGGVRGEIGGSANCTWWAVLHPASAASQLPVNESNDGRDFQAVD
jgi:hypothetical protein